MTGSKALAPQISVRKAPFPGFALNRFGTPGGDDRAEGARFLAPLPKPRPALPLALTPPSRGSLLAILLPKSEQLVPQERRRGPPPTSGLFWS